MADQIQNTPQGNQGQQITLKQFADSIRSKYPDSKLYKSKSDLDLSKAFIASDSKYQVYKTRIKDWPLESTSKTIGYPGGIQWPIIPKNLGTGREESFQDTIKRGIAASKTDKLGQEVAFDPQKRNEYLKKTLRELPYGKAAATYGVMVALPFAIAELHGVATGKTVAKLVEHLKQPGTIAKFPYGRAVEYYLLTKAGMSKSAINQLLKIVQ